MQGMRYRNIMYTVYLLLRQDRDKGIVVMKPMRLLLKSVFETA